MTDRQRKDELRRLSAFVHDILPQFEDDTITVGPDPATGAVIVVTQTRNCYAVRITPIG